MTTALRPRAPVDVEDRVYVRMRMAADHPTLQDLGEHLQTVGELVALASVTLTARAADDIFNLPESRQSDFMNGLLYGLASELTVLRLKMTSP